MEVIRGVSVDFIDGLNASARSTYPDEFVCFHSAEDGVIEEMILVPGSVYGEDHSMISDWMAPLDLSLSGSAHSHPGYSNEPSEADIDFFGYLGGVHFITCQPYDRTSWKAYDSNGRALDLKMIY